ncbi:predicted protein [Coccidioides posadasii str. Silveira]|uniref:Predicted protein n=1 Tax=Coccidioides posadasii (strain RMSCC 757 / Silveira) TaxID=443226 RepID=E9D6P3_COCPS|nr:predicted protein [Coccidioides posadasii str. Silveira]
MWSITHQEHHPFPCSNAGAKISQDETPGTTAIDFEHSHFVTGLNGSRLLLRLPLVLESFL